MCMEENKYYVCMYVCMYARIFIWMQLYYMYVGKYVVRIRVIHFYDS